MHPLIICIYLRTNDRHFHDQGNIRHPTSKWLKWDLLQTLNNFRNPSLRLFAPGKASLVQGWKRSTVSLKTPVLLCSQHAQSFKEKILVFRKSRVCKSSAGYGQIQEKLSTDAYWISVPTAVFPTPRFDLLDPGTVFYCSWTRHFFNRTRQVEHFMLHYFECFSEANFYQLLWGY